MLLDFKGDQPDERGLCRTQQRKSIAALCLLALIFSVLVWVACSEFDLNQRLTNVELEYKESLAFGILADLHLDSSQNDTYCLNSDTYKKEWIVHHSTSYGAKLCDSSLALINVTMSELKNKESKMGNFEFILILGDQIGHWINGTEPSLKSFEKIQSLITARFPSTPIYFTIGNHDLSTLFSKMPMNPEWYSLLWQSLSPGLRISQSQIQSETKLFQKYGFYKVKHSKNLWIVSLNTNLFYDYINVTDETIDAQFTWLNKTFYEAQVEGSVNIILIGHIPPNIELTDASEWDTSKNITWKPQCTAKFNELVAKFSSIIKITFFAHQHADGWYAGKSSDGTNVSHFIMPAVSPVTKGHSTFSVGIANKEWELLDILYYICPVEILTRLNTKVRFYFEQSFKQKYFDFHMKYIGMQASVMRELTERLISLEDGLQTYTTHLLSSYQYRYKPHVSPFQMFCVMTENTSEGLDTCLKKYFF